MGSILKVTRNELPEREIELTVELIDDDLDPFMDRAYQKVGQQAKIDGFRKGKVPKSILNSYFGVEYIKNEAFNIGMPSIVQNAIVDNADESVGRPLVNIVSEDPLTLKINIGLEPKVTLDAYREIRVPKEPVTIPEEQIEAVITDLRWANSNWVPMERPVANDDQITIDLIAKVEDKEVANQTDVVYLVTEHNNRPVEGFHAYLLDMVLNDTKTFTIPFPEEYEDKEVAGKECEFTVTLKDVKAKDLAELDDEFAKGIGDGFETVAELREQIKNNLFENANTTAQREYENKILEELKNRSTLEASQILIDQETQAIIDNQAETLKQNKVNLEQYLSIIGKQPEEFQEEARQSATDRLTTTYALETLAELEGITITDEDLEKEISDAIEASEDRKEEIEKTFSTEDSRSNLRNMLSRRKTLERLIEIAEGENTSAKKGTKTVKPKTTKPKTTKAKATKAKPKSSK